MAVWCDGDETWNLNMSRAGMGSLARVKSYLLRAARAEC